jgi:hypothetical protein
MERKGDWFSASGNIAEGSRRQIRWRVLQIS